MAKGKMNTVDWVALVLLLVGGLNWGLVGAWKFNLVEVIFGNTLIANIIYVAVGISAVYSIYSLYKLHK